MTAVPLVLLPSTRILISVLKSAKVIKWVVLEDIAANQQTHAFVLVKFNL